MCIVWGTQSRSAVERTELLLRWTGGGVVGQVEVDSATLNPWPRLRPRIWESPPPSHFTRGHTLDLHRCDSGGGPVTLS